MEARRNNQKQSVYLLVNVSHFVNGHASICLHSQSVFSKFLTGPILGRAELSPIASWKGVISFQSFELLLFYIYHFKINCSVPLYLPSANSTVWSEKGHLLTADELIHTAKEWII